MSDAETFAVLFFLLSIATGYAVGLYLYRTKPRKKSREQLRRELEQAERRHGPRRHIRKLYQQATCEELRQ